MMNSERWPMRAVSTWKLACIRDKGFPETLFNPDMCRVRNKDILNAIN